MWCLYAYIMADGDQILEILSGIYDPYGHIKPLKPLGTEIKNKILLQPEEL